MPKMVDLTGQKFDMLTVIGITDKRSCGSIVWKCKCDCGNICERAAVNLKRKGHHSCGCWNEQQIKNLNKKNLIGQRFGKLVVIEETEDRDSGGTIIWKCKCDCGNITYVRTNSLTSGNTSSCGCINYSIGENNIKEILKNNNLDYCAQFTEPELKLKKFDFAIFQNNQIIRLIEFDGQQHFNDISGIWNSPESLEDIQQRDQEKNIWAKKHNIPLVRIPYWERNNITLDMIMGDQYLVKDA